MNKRYTQTYRDVKSKKAASPGLLSGWRASSKRPRAKTKRLRSEERYADAVFFSRPYHSSSQKSFTPPISKKALVASAIVMLFAVWFGLMFYLPYFNLQVARLTGLKSIKNQDMMDQINQYLGGRTYLVFNNRNFFIANPTTLKQTIEQKFFLQDIEITKAFPNQLYIDIHEKITSLIYDNGSQYVILDQNGAVVQNLKNCTDECVPLANQAQNFDSTTTPAAFMPTSTAPTAPKDHRPKYNSFALEYLDVPVVYDLRQQAVEPGAKNILPSDLIQNIIIINNRIRKTEKSFSVTYFEYSGEGSEVKVNTDQGFKILINAAADLNAQFNNIKTVLKDSRPKDYIDVRYDSRVFWK